jgi:hypothetical protein
MKRTVVYWLSLMLLIGGLASCGYSTNSGSGSGTSATSRPGY